jgi:Zn-dependent M28 family amino/carboxypeptidase
MMTIGMIRRNRLLFIYYVLTAGLLSSCTNLGSEEHVFNGELAYQDAEIQMSFGPRLPDSQAHSDTAGYILSELQDAGWATEIQTANILGFPIKNIIAKRGEGQPWFVVGAHYDTRIHADRDLNIANRLLPVPGANDGASGVAVLLELARSLPPDINGQVWLVFFDAEDNGGIQDREWIMGSIAFVQQLVGQPDGVIIVDMVGDANLNIHLEKNSDPVLAASIWEQAAELGYADYFINQPYKAILDDHIPFLQAGIPAIDIIDFDYPNWHTIDDTLDKISAESMQIVGSTLQAWLTKQMP